MRIAVSGATGFIGGHVLSVLAEEPGVEVVAIVRDDRESVGSVHAVGCDVCQPPVDLFDRLGRPDALIHLAWGGLPHYREHWHFKRELPAAYALVSNLVEAGVGTIFATGTCFEYGMRDGALQEEMVTSPHLPYGFAKDALRRQLEFLKERHDFSLTWGRLFYLWGEGQTSSIYGLLTAAAARGDRVFPMSEGAQLRDYLHVSEAATMIAQIAVARLDAGILNICSGRPVAMRQMVEHWCTLNGWPIIPELGQFPYTDYEPMAFWGDRTKLNRVLGTLN